MNSPDEYEAYFAWRSKPLPVWMREKLEATATPYWVRLLELVREARANHRRGRPSLPFGLRAALSARSTRLARRLAGKPTTKVQFQ